MFKTKSIFVFALLFATLCGCQKNRLGGEKNGSLLTVQRTEERPLQKFNLQYLMVGKNQIEVEELMGVPEGRTLGQDGYYLWDYRRPVLDDESDKVFEWSLVTFYFSQGKCSKVDVTLSDPPVQLSAEQ
jgi:hypothetical protein